MKNIKLNKLKIKTTPNFKESKNVIQFNKNNIKLFIKH